MKAITIHQPWASLIAHGYKRFETRGWKTKYRGPLAIHAGKKIDHQAVMMLARKHPEIWREISPLPAGCVVAVAELAECWQVIEIDRNTFMTDSQCGEIIACPIHELSFGDYSIGRYAWELVNVRYIDPVPAKGQQGLWNWGGERDGN